MHVSRLLRWECLDGKLVLTTLQLLTTPNSFTWLLVALLQFLLWFPP
jgi:hypothetical protein